MGLVCSGAFRQMVIYERALGAFLRRTRPSPLPRVERPLAVVVQRARGSLSGQSSSIASCCPAGPVGPVGDVVRRRSTGPPTGGRRLCVSLTSQEGTCN